MYELPDGTKIQIGNEMFRVGEIFFRPGNIGRSMYGLPQSIYRVVNKCDIEWRNIMYDNIVLSGGNTAYVGITTRLESELVKLLPSNTKIKIEDRGCRFRKYLTWDGGSILGAMDSFKDMMITQDEYKEVGAAIVHKKDLYKK